MTIISEKVCDYHQQRAVSNLTDTGYLISADDAKYGGLSKRS